MKKKVLFISPKFMGYYKEIIKEMEAANYDVDYIADSPKDTILFKALNRLNKKLTIKYSEKNFLRELKELVDKKDYDYLFVIAGMTFCLPKSFFEYLEEKNVKIKKMIYQWDGEENLSFVKDYHKYFDKIFTFDRIDVENNDKYLFLPLFYIRNYEEIAQKNIKEFDYDVSYIGTAHPQKFYYVNKISKELSKIKNKQFIYHYIPTKLKYFYHKIKNKEYKDAKMSDFKYEKISFEQIGKIFEGSECILDAPQKGQNGLTIRTIECLGAKKKLITINQDVINYDFYKKENIYVYNEENGIDFDNVFFNTEYINIESNVYEKYSLRNWVKNIFKGE